MGSDDAEKFRQKKEAFDILDSASDDESPDPGRHASQTAWKKVSKKKVDLPQAPIASKPLARSSSDTRLHVRAQQAKQTEKPPSSSAPQSSLSKRPIKPAAISSLRKTVSDVAKPKPVAQLTGKRKHSSFAEDAVSEEQQIFKGLRFYFFPNNEAHPARRLRIAKAVQFGATWDTEWNDAVTHAVLDKSMDYNQLIKYLRVDKLPEGVVVVSENYPAECISYRSLLEPRQTRFAVKGHEQPSFKKVDSTDSDTSLQLKPPTKPAAARQTPPPDNVHVPGTVLNDAPEDPSPETAAAERIPNSFEAPDSNKELEDAIKTAKTLVNVPLDEEGRPDSADGPDSGDEDNGSGLKLLNKRRSKNQRMQDKFQCFQKHTGDKSGLANQTTIDILQQMADYYGQMGDEWRIRAYRKAISSLRNCPQKVNTKEEALALPNIGERIAIKIEEIAFTNKLRRLDNAKAEPSDQVLQAFMGVYGAGIVQANRWVREGYTSLDELLQKADLTENQRIGIHHYEDFGTRIPRAEVEQHGNIVRNALRAIDPAFQVIVGGSYRRGSKDSGDIDCIVTRPDTNADHLRNVVLGQLVPELTKKGFLVASLAITSKDDGSKWHGASCLPSSKVWRRLDLLLVPSDELGAALIYFTGNDIFNRSLRLLASTKGMRLNQRGLYRDVIRGPQRVKLTEGTLVEGKDEKKIFAALGVPWRPPEHRIC